MSPFFDPLYILALPELPSSTIRRHEFFFLMPSRTPIVVKFVRKFAPTAYCVITVLHCRLFMFHLIFFSRHWRHSVPAPSQHVWAFLGNRHVPCITSSAWIIFSFSVLLHLISIITASLSPGLHLQRFLHSSFPMCSYHAYML